MPDHPTAEALAAAQKRYDECVRAIADIDEVATRRKAPLVAEAQSLKDILSQAPELERLAAIRRHQEGAQRDRAALAAARYGTAGYPFTRPALDGFKPTDPADTPTPAAVPAPAAPLGNTDPAK